MRLQTLALTTTTLLLAACGGDDTSITSCAQDEFNAVDAELVLPESLAANSELLVQLVSKEGNRNIAKDGAKLSCIRDIKECTGTITTEKARPGLYTLTAYDAKGLPVGSTAVEIKKASSEAGCSAKLAASINTELKAYVLNLPLSGTLGETLQHRLGANFWTGQTDGIVMLSAADLDKLSQAQQIQLKEAYKAKQFVVVANPKQADLEKFAKLVGERSAPIGLKDNVPYVDIFAMGSSPAALTDVTVVYPVSAGEGWQPLGIEDDYHKAIRVNKFVELFKNSKPVAKPRLSQPSLVTASDAVSDATVEVDALAASVMFKQQITEGYNTGTCNKQLLDPCYNTYQEFANFWPVYVESTSNNITDYFIVVMSANLDASGCYSWYHNASGVDNTNRLLGYFAQHYYQNTKAYKSTANGGSTWSFDDLSVMTNYQPQTTSNSVDVTNGTTFSLSGTGSVGGTAAGPTGSVGFTAGVSWNNTTKTTYETMMTSVKLPARSDFPASVQWDYDSKNYVKSSVMPGDQACGSDGFKYANTDASEVSTTFSPQQTFIWQASKNVREQLAQAQGVAAYGSDPIKLTTDLNLGVLLGWAYWPDIYGQCDGTGALNSSNCSANGYYGPLDGGFCAGINETSGGEWSLIFDVGCGTNTEWGTVPLGPTDKSGGDGNPGTPKNFNFANVFIPLAYASAAPQ